MEATKRVEIQMEIISLISAWRKSNPELTPELRVINLSALGNAESFEESKKILNKYPDNGYAKRIYKSLMAIYQ